ncbi:MAG: glycosyltransferase [Propionibacteriaceae bacterium]
MTLTERPVNHRSVAQRSSVWCAETELSAPPTLRAVSPQLDPTASVRVLVRLHGEPVGYLTFDEPVGELDPGLVHACSRVEFADQIGRHLDREGLAGSGLVPGQPLPPATVSCPNHVATTEPVSVVVCTRDQPEHVRGCLERLARLTYPLLEVVVVDNAPSDDRTRDLVLAHAGSDPRFRYVRESRPGLSVARNRGLSEASHRYVAFTDDDVAVDERWIHGLLRGFRAAPHVACVTGLVCTASISSEAEAYFDARSPSWSSRCEPEVFDLTDHRRDSAVYPYSAGIFGTGANFAFDRDALGVVGEFDEALGAGTRTRGGEDLDMFVRILLSGFAIAYEPAAIVWHHHRADDAALLRQMFGYGSGLTAYLTKCVVRSSSRWGVLRAVPAGLLRMAAIRTKTQERLPELARSPRRAWAREVAGYLAGPWLYLLAARSARSGRSPFVA